MALSSPSKAWTIGGGPRLFAENNRDLSLSARCEELYGAAGSRWLAAIGEADIACQSDGEEGRIVEMAIGFFEQAWSKYMG